MKLAIFLSSGEGMHDLRKTGQDSRFKKYYLDEYSKRFEKIYLFSYLNEEYEGLPDNIELVPNKNNLHRYIYGIVLPLLHYDKIKRCDVIRVFHVLGTIPAVICKIIFNKPFTYNYGYDYISFAKIDKKYLQILLIGLSSFLANKFAKKVIVVIPVVFKYVPKEKRVYIPNGVDTNMFIPVNKRKRNKKSVILSVGRLEKQKNYYSLIKALRGMEVVLKIIGNGSLKKDLTELAKNEKVDLEIIDQVKNEELPKFYNKADLFVLPSFNEGFAKVLIEAMSCALPVVVSKVGGLAEIIADNENGVFCETSAESIRERINYLLDNPELAHKLGLNARKEVIEKYDINTLVKKEIDLINQLPSQN